MSHLLLGSYQNPGSQVLLCGKKTNLRHIAGRHPSAATRRRVSIQRHYEQTRVGKSAFYLISNYTMSRTVVSSDRSGMANDIHTRI